MTEERQTPQTAGDGKGKYVTLAVLLAFVALVFALTILKFAKAL